MSYLTFLCGAVVGCVLTVAVFVILALLAANSVDPVEDVLP